MKKPSWFRTIDSCLIAALVGTVALLVYMLMHAEQTPWDFWFAIVVCILLASTYVYVLVEHYLRMSEFVWLPNLNMMVHPGGYELSKYAIDDYLRSRLHRWELLYPGITGKLLEKTTWVWFDKDLNTTVDMLAGKYCKGYYVANSRTFKVDYDTPTDDLRQTALLHEFGHLLLRIAGKKWDPDGDHKFFVEHGLG